LDLEIEPRLSASGGRQEGDQCEGPYYHGSLVSVRRTRAVVAIVGGWIRWNISF
jgi:hypothetical protein